MKKNELKSAFIGTIISLMIWIPILTSLTSCGVEDKPVVTTVVDGVVDGEPTPVVIPSRFEMIEHKDIHDEDGYTIFESTILKVDEHEYVVVLGWSSDAGGGLLHSESCPCKKPIDHPFKDI